MRIFGAMRMALLLACIAATLPAAAAEGRTFNYEKLNDTVHVLYGGGGNIGVSAGEDGVFVIDDNYEGDKDAISIAVAQFSDQPVRFVINTHWHFDHAGSNKGFGAAGSLIIAHDNVRERLAAGNYLSIHEFEVPPAAAEALPVVTFNDTLTLHFNGEAVEVVHVRAAHTDGDAIVRFTGSNIIHAGDVFLNGIYPFVDIDSGGTVPGSIAAVDRLLDMTDEDTVIIPGHGPIASRADVAAYRSMISAIGDSVAAMKARGLSLEDVIAANPTAPFDDRWNSWGVGWKTISLTSIYRSLP